jgi:hypothetical protein
MHPQQPASTRTNWSARASQSVAVRAEVLRPRGGQRSARLEYASLIRQPAHGLNRSSDCHEKRAEEREERRHADIVPEALRGPSNGRNFEPVAGYWDHGDLGQSVA